MAHLDVRLHRPSLPQLFGLGVFGVGSCLDLAFHAAPLAWQPFLERYLGPAGVNAHLITFVGMLLVLATLLQTALGSGRAGPTRRR